jgi:hypothetical protein
MLAYAHMLPCVRKLLSHATGNMHKIKYVTTLRSPNTFVNFPGENSYVFSNTTPYNCVGDKRKLSCVFQHILYTKCVGNRPQNSVCPIAV